MEHWAEWLPELCCSAIRFDQPGRVLASLHQYNWTALRSLALEFRDSQGISPDVAAAMHRSLTHDCMPLLRTLRLRCPQLNNRPAPCATLTTALLAVLPQLSGLTELDVDFGLDGLIDEQPDGWLPGLHLLPQLRVLRCDINTELDTGSAFAISIAQAPRLEVLHVQWSSTVRVVCEWMAMRCEAASCSGEGRTPEAAVPLRELHLSDQIHWPEEQYLGADELRSLAALPHLECLSGRVLPSDVPLLGALRRLRSLSVRVDPVGWGDAAVRALGRLRLPLLERVALDGATGCVYEEKGDGGRLRCAAPSPLTAAAGLRHLLLLPSLRQIRLPWVAPDALAFLRHLAARSGRPAPLSLDTPPPPPMRISEPGQESVWARCLIGPDPRAGLDIEQLNSHHCNCCCG